MLTWCGVTQAANRMLFNQAEDEFLDGDEVVGMGTLGKEGSGRLRMQVSPTALVLQLQQFLVIVDLNVVSVKREWSGARAAASKVLHCLMP